MYQPFYGATSDKICSVLVQLHEWYVSSHGYINGNMIIWGNTNTLPAINTNYTYLATATNAPGFLFVSSNGVWVRK